jgi:protein-tyrosine phosphatase
MPSILFVCTANQFRSPIAEACFSKKLREVKWKSDWKIQSAGTWAIPGQPVIDMTRQIGENLKLSLDHHITKSVTTELLLEQDLILVMENGHREALQSEFYVFRPRIFLLSEVVDGTLEDIPDPINESYERCQATAIKLRDMVDRGFYRICAQALRLRRYTR